MSTPEISPARWFVSSRSSNNGDCVECAVLPGQMAVRDSKDRSGPVLVFPAYQWSAFIAATTAGGVGAFR